MSRDDSMLYSGMSSPRKVELDKKKDEVKKLDKKAESVLEEIKKLKEEVTSIEHVLLDDSLGEEVRLRRIERIKGDYDLLNKLEKRMKLILGVKNG